jgi:hypothetical protein
VEVVFRAQSLFRRREYFVKVIGEDFQDAENVHRNCEATERLALGLMELLGMNLVVWCLHLRKILLKEIIQS